MSLSVLSGPTSNFNPYTRDQAPLWQILAYAFFGVGSAAQRFTAQSAVLQKADIKARAKTTDNSAASKVIDITARGVTFPAGTFRKIRFTSFATSDNDSWFQEWEQVVWGNDGVTPKLLGSARLIQAYGEIAGTVATYGNCHAQATYSTDTATAVAANSSLGSSLGNNSTNTITLTHPIARSSPKYIKGINNCPAAATASGARHVAALTANSTTFSLFVTDLATPSAASPAPSALDVEFFILPPPSVAIVMNSNAVELHAGHDASDDVYHDLAVFVGAAETHLHVAD